MWHVLVVAVITRTAVSIKISLDKGDCEHEKEMENTMLELLNFLQMD